MPTENRRVAAYLPKNIDKQLETFKTERGLKGDSPAIIAILEAFFGVSQEVAHLSSSEAINLTQRIEAVEQKLFQMKGELFSELQGELKNYLYGELRGELLGRHIQETEVLGSEQVSKSNSELLDESQIIHSETASLPNKLVNELPLNLLSEPLIKPISGLLLAQRLNCHSDTLSKIKSKLSEEEFYQWSMSKDPDRVAWKFLKKGRKYLPASELPDELLSKLLNWIEQDDTASQS